MTGRFVRINTLNTISVNEFHEMLFKVNSIIQNDMFKQGFHFELKFQSDEI